MARREIKLKSRGGVEGIKKCCNGISDIAHRCLGKEESKKFMSSFMEQYGIEPVFHVTMNKAELETWQAIKKKELGSATGSDASASDAGAAKPK